MRVTENMELLTRTLKNKLTIPEATIATSFMNFLPTMFAATQEDLLRLPIKEKLWRLILIHSSPRVPHLTL